MGSGLTVRDDHDDLRMISVCTDKLRLNSYQDAFMNHPSQSSVGRIVNYDGLATLRRVRGEAREEFCNFCIDPGRRRSCKKHRTLQCSYNLDVIFLQSTPRSADWLSREYRSLGVSSMWRKSCMSEASFAAEGILNTQKLGILLLRLAFSFNCERPCR